MHEDDRLASKRLAALRLAYKYSLTHEEVPPEDLEAMFEEAAEGLPAETPAETQI